MIEQYQISVYELDLRELVDRLEAIESQLIKLEKLYYSPIGSKKFLDELLTRQEVAKYFKVNISTIRNWTKKGILIKYGVGDRVFYKRSEIEEALKPIEFY